MRKATVKSGLQVENCEKRQPAEKGAVSGRYKASGLLRLGFLLDFGI